MNTSSSLRFLFGLEMFGIKVGLRNISLLLDASGHPERDFPAIHVAGTNGKGSVSSMMAAVLSAAGLKTGLYTSPHLLDFSERIRVNGVPISSGKITRYTNQLAPVIRKTKATFFEATTAIAFNHFRDSSVDIAVVETGLGGRLDATNVVTPLVSVITTIGLDHTEHLGSTVQAIAREKAGIIKPNVPVVTGEENPEVLAILRRVARRNNAPFIRAQHDVHIDIKDRSIRGISIKLEAGRLRISNLTLDLPGDHQALNACIALSALLHLPNRLNQLLNKETVIDGLSSVRRRSALHGRMELIRRNPPVLVDVAHNLHGLEVSIHSLRKFVPGKWLVLFGVMKDKDYREMLSRLMKNSRLIVAVRPDTGRALSSRAIVEYVHESGSKALDGGSVSEGIRIAFRELREGEPLLIIGSHYLAGEVLKFLNIAV